MYNDAEGKKSRRASIKYAADDTRWEDQGDLSPSLSLVSSLWDEELRANGSKRNLLSQRLEAIIAWNFINPSSIFAA